MLEELRDKVSGILETLGRKLASAGLTGNYLTLLGLVAMCLAFLLLYLGDNLGASVAILVSGLLDVLDGAVARAMNQASPLGSFLDSVTDRVEDGLLLLGMGIYSGDLLLSALAIHSSLLVSYVRAKAESLGISGTQYSIAGRAERLILAAAFCILDEVVLGLLVIALLNYITALERTIISIRKIMRGE